MSTINNKIQLIMQKSKNTLINIIKMYIPFIYFVCIILKKWRDLSICKKIQTSIVMFKHQMSIHVC
ncbi:MAG: hypothetical protein K0R54_567 [Clostridiaceae bacterium]|jgi:Na+-translocating ferredoxin:NAD+ oxidoreductase RnfE subunit|nr:hypothetical protein [Clostridiaceae bacterium]